MDAVISLDAAADFITRTTTHPHYWKWAVLALHSAMQGFLVLALRKGDGFLVQKPGHANQMIAAHDNQTRIPDQYMDNFNGLYKKAQDPGNFRSGAPALPTDPEFDLKIKVFDQMRNDFIHFNTKGWSISIVDLVTHSKRCIKVIQSMIDNGEILWHEELLSAEASLNLKKVKAAIGELR